MAVRRSASFGTYFFVGVIGLLIGSVIGKTLIIVLKSQAITQIINLNDIAQRFYISAGYTFTLNLFAIIGVLLAIYIYRRI